MRLLSVGNSRDWFPRVNIEAVHDMGLCSNKNGIATIWLILNCLFVVLVWKRTDTQRYETVRGLYNGLYSYCCMLAIQFIQLHDHDFIQSLGERFI